MHQTRSPKVLLASQPPLRTIFTDFPLASEEESSLQRNEHACYNSGKMRRTLTFNGKRKANPKRRIRITAPCSEGSLARPSLSKLEVRPG